MHERLNAGDRRFLAICALLLALTVWFSAKFFYRAFPEASIDFRVSRGGARQRAGQFLAGQGFQLDGYREASRFQYDDNAKTFLERQLGLEQANRLMGSRVRLWRWSERWFRPRQKEEFRVDITPSGAPVGFRHEIDEAAALPSLTQDQARAQAEDFLRRRMGRDPGVLDFVEGSSTQRPRRTDHTFTWKERDFNVQDATYRVEVTVLGNQVGGYREYLKVPEAWQRGYDRLRSGNMTASQIDAAVMLLLVVGLLVALMAAVRAGDVRWRRASVVGLIGAGLSFLASCNGFSLAEFGYATTDSYGSFVSRQLLNYVLEALAAGGLLFALTAAAEPVYRRAYGDRISLGHLFSARGLRTRSFLRGSVLGITLAGVFVAYQTAFYLIAYHFGAWSPADVPYDDLLNTRLPWLFVLFGGFLPAVSEEFLFRMFAIPYLRKVTRSLAAAVVLAAFIWGFGHAAYPQQPFYIRGVEVGIGGVALGLIMLRWGILPTLVWHYSVDAMYSALLLMRSHDAYLAVSGAASAGIMLLPVAVALVLYARHGGFAAEKELTNAAENAGAPPEAPVEPVTSPPLPDVAKWSGRRRIAAAALAAAGGLFLLVHVDRFGDRPKFAVSPGEAHSMADEFLHTQGIDPRGYRTAIFTETRWSNAEWHPDAVGKYFLERRPIAYLAQAFRLHVPLYRWVVRYYKPLDAEELRVSVNPETGAVFQFEHRFPEDRAGANLAPEAARMLASDFLARRGFDLEGFQLQETSSELKKARRDHVLVWEARPGDARNLDEARYRLRVTVAGDQVSSYGAFWKAPETFLRARGGQNALTIALTGLNIVWIALAVVLALWLLIQGTRTRSLSWRTALRLAWPIAALGVAGRLAQFPSLYQSYDTAIPLDTFRAVMITGTAIAAIGLALMAAGGVAVLLAVEPAAAGAFSRASRRAGAWDALLGAAAAAALFAAVRQAGWLLLDRFPALALPSPAAPGDFSSAAPALSALAGAATQALFLLVGLALGVYVYRRIRGSLALLGASGVVLLAALVTAQAHTAGEFALYFALEALGLAAVVGICRLIGRGNLLAYALAAWTLALGSRALAFLAAPAPPLHRQGWVLVAALGLTAAWVAAPALGARGEPGKLLETSVSSD